MGISQSTLRQGTGPIIARIAKIAKNLKAKCANFRYIRISKTWHGKKPPNLSMYKFINDNKGFSVLIALNIILVGVDLFSTLRLGELATYLEANPIYPYIGFVGILALNGIILTLSYFIYSRYDVTPRFMVIWYLTVLFLTRIVVIYNNNQVYIDPPSIEAAMAVTQAQKTEFVMRSQVMVNIFPMLNTAITYLFFKQDHIIIKKGENKRD